MFLGIAICIVLVVHNPSITPNLPIYFTIFCALIVFIEHIKRTIHWFRIFGILKQKKEDEPLWVKVQKLREESIDIENDEYDEFDEPYELDDYDLDDEFNDDY